MSQVPHHASFTAFTRQIASTLHGKQSKKQHLSWKLGSTDGKGLAILQITTLWAVLPGVLLKAPCALPFVKLQAHPTICHCDAAVGNLIWQATMVIQP